MHEIWGREGRQLQEQEEDQQYTGAEEVIQPSIIGLSTSFELNTYKEEGMVMQEYDMCLKQSGFSAKDNLVREFPKKVGENNRNRKTPHQYRTEAVRIKTRNDLSASAKKTFKESFNTDKSRLDKRQAQHSRSLNFLLILEDNVHSAECTSGKLILLYAFLNSFHS